MMNSLILDLNKNTEAFKTSFGHLNGQELNWKPAPESWSIAQVVDHLVRISESYFPLIAQLKEGTHKLPWFARFSFVPKLLGNMLLKAVQPGNSSKTKTFGIWEPARSNISADIIGRFEAHQATLQQLMEDSRNLVAQQAVISSPASKLIVYRLGTAFEILVAHEKRHLAQARAVLELLRSADAANERRQANQA